MKVARYEVSNVARSRLLLVYTLFFLAATESLLRCWVREAGIEAPRDGVLRIPVARPLVNEERHDGELRVRLDQKALLD